MKLIGSLLVLCCVSYTLAMYTEGHDGHPACHTPQEVGQRFWRNNNDPTKYWVCSLLGRNADEAFCELEYMFYEPSLTCVHYTQWQWTEPRDPPSMVY